MNTPADLHRAVQATITGKRLGTPVFVRYLYHRPVAGPARRQNGPGQPSVHLPGTCAEDAHREARERTP